MLAIIVWTRRKRSSSDAGLPPLTPVAPKGTPIVAKVSRLGFDPTKMPSVIPPVKPSLLPSEPKERSYTPPPQVKRTHTPPPPGSPR